MGRQIEVKSKHENEGRDKNVRVSLSVYRPAIIHTKTIGPESKSTGPGGNLESVSDWGTTV
jgi:hypothetical protein